ncbi:MAG: chromosome segregation protein SMC [Methylohalobius crimeensis]
MRLEKIKLAGFKSFADPTALVFPGRLIGVVGPNGCGKSNIIDAVRFVIGESSAKHLRGSAMADVVFNGSSNRKPVSLAGIELVFDNHEGRLGGEYARYAQIALKRQVTREGQSQYFLNGARCRRRDVMDVLLGTGLGPRSYAIIEQGMVSRFVEAKPEDLRLFVEEAAGLSKYKERRRETELKLQHVRANLDRVEDIRGELQGQVKRLARQAKKAEQYRELTRSIEQRQAELTAIQWRQAETEHRRHQAELQGMESELAGRESALEEAENEVTEARSQTQNLTQNLQSQQAKLYDLNAAISQCDQNLRHAQKTLQERERSLDAWRAELERSQCAIAETQTELEHLEREHLQVQAEWEQHRSRVEQIQAQRQTAKNRRQEARQAFERQGEVLKRTESEAQLLEVEIRHLEGHHSRNRTRLEQLAGERRQLEQSRDSGAVDALARQLSEIQTRREAQQEAIQSTSQTIRRLQDEKQAIERRIKQSESESSRLQGKLSALETLQRHALGKDHERLNDWLKALGLQDAPRLAEALESEADWELAVETALAEWLESVCLEDLASVAQAAPELEENAAFVLKHPTLASSVPADSLTGKVTSPMDLAPLLGGFRCTESLDTALARREELATHERWITPGGDQVGPTWLQLRQRGESNQGVLERQKALRELRGSLDTLDRERSRDQAEKNRVNEALSETERDLETLRSGERDSHSRHSRLQAELGAARTRQKEIQTRLERLAREYESTEKDNRALADKLAEHRRELARKTEAKADQEAAAGKLQADLNRAHAEFDRIENEARRQLDHQHRLEARREKIEHARGLLRQQLARAERQESQLRERLRHAEAEQTEGKAPIQAAERELTSLLERRPALEKDLARTRAAVQEAEAGLRDSTERKQQAEAQRDQARSALEQARLAAEAARVRWQAAQNEVATQAVDLDRTLASLPPSAGVAGWRKRLEQLKADQARLGDVNLAAIEEHRQHSERLRFLDKQHADLESSVEMLEKAIRKIDRESRATFRATFDAVNGHFRERFPALFGGGEARLELTGDDPLDAGVRIVARPPGKRNSSIQLLSGGEKALTAVALVFSFFELNPAPVCFLDEVDAPLDEANVGRFCQLLKSMSEQVQFIFVTHNKATMEIADQLIGVTMREPGISRIVAVDLKQAAEMAAA